MQICEPQDTAHVRVKILSTSIAIMTMVIVRHVVSTVTIHRTLEHYLQRYTPTPWTHFHCLRVQPIARLKTFCKNMFQPKRKNLHTANFKLVSRGRNFPLAIFCSLFLYRITTTTHFLLSTSVNQILGKFFVLGIAQDSLW
jgi:hypothetical protein